jgi:hypothetical protein
MGVISNGTTLLDAGALDSGVATGAMTLISTTTASSSSTISFTSGIDSTYDEYVFKFYDIHPATDNTFLTFQADTGTNTNYNQTITSTFFKSLHDESGGTTALSYDTSSDLAQSTSFQHLSRNVGNDNDQSIAGTLQVFSPSSSTFVKHFISRTNVYTNDDYSIDSAIAGYFNTTTAITRFQFKMASGNMDSGTIKMYGIK